MAEAAVFTAGVSTDQSHMMSSKGSKQRKYFFAAVADGETFSPGGGSVQPYHPGQLTNVYWQALAADDEAAAILDTATQVVTFTTAEAVASGFLILEGPN